MSHAHVRIGAEDHRMETLPLEIVVKLARLLAPKDLASCCGVSQDWRDIFNDDCHWRPHCDPSLEQHLRTTPCVVDPAFVIPEATNSTLTPISRWRLAFLRQKHLWKNVKMDNYKRECVQRLKGEFERDFIGNNLLVRWCKDRIEIWDVSVIPATFVAKTDSSVDQGDCYDRYRFYRSVVGSSILLVELVDQVKVFQVDAVNSRINLKHSISFDEASRFFLPEMRGITMNLVKGSIYVRVCPRSLNMEIIDIETGAKKKKERCPVRVKGNEKAVIFGIKSSPYSDNVVVVVQLSSTCGSNIRYQCYIYNLGQLAFLPGPGPEVKHCSWYLNSVAIHGPYLAVCDKPTIHAYSLNIYNYHTLQIICTTESVYLIEPLAINDGFIFPVVGQEFECRLNIYSLKNKKLITSLHSFHSHCPTMRLLGVSPIRFDGENIVRNYRTYRPLLEMLTDKILRTNVETIFGYSSLLWEASGQAVRHLLNIPSSVKFRDTVNQALTRAIVEENFWEYLYIFHNW